MAKLGAGSLAQLGTCDPELQRLVKEVVRRLPAPLDLKVICGWRSMADQAAAYATGKSQKKPGESLHNVMNSRAVDMALYPVKWPDEAAFGFLAGFVAAVAATMTPPVRVRWGGDWDSDGDTLEHRFRDLDHWELM